jgi:hypothetical protein
MPFDAASCHPVYGLILLAMQKVEGSSPFSRFPCFICKSHGLRSRRRLAQSLDGNWCARLAHTPRGTLDRRDHLNRLIKPRRGIDVAVRCREWWKAASGPPPDQASVDLSRDELVEWAERWGVPVEAALRWYEQADRPPAWLRTRNCSSRHPQGPRGELD